eukprot:4484007-Pyramimonas_sp.AAC.1
MHPAYYILLRPHYRITISGSSRGVVRALAVTGTGGPVKRCYHYTASRGGLEGVRRRSGGGLEGVCMGGRQIRNSDRLVPCSVVFVRRRARLGRSGVTSIKRVLLSCPVGRTWRE